MAERLVTFGRFATKRQRDEAVMRRTHLEHLDLRALMHERSSYCRAHDPRPKRYREKRGSGWKASRFRAAVLAKTGGRCAVCGSSEDVEAHHLRPLHLGGTDAHGGMPLCRRCHHRVLA